VHRVIVTGGRRFDGAPLQRFDGRSVSEKRRPGAGVRVGAEKSGTTERLEADQIETDQQHGVGFPLRHRRGERGPPGQAAATSNPTSAVFTAGARAFAAHRKYYFKSRT